MGSVKLIADSGATKVEWGLLSGDKRKIITTKGISPYFLTPEEIQKLLAGIDVRFLNEDQYTRYKTESPQKRAGFRFPRKP